MQSLSEAIASVLANLGSVGHIEARPGDFIGEDGRLHCGVCKMPRDFKLPVNGRYVPCACKCVEDEQRKKDAEMQRRRELDVVREMASYSLVDERFYQSTFEHFKTATQGDRQVLNTCLNYVRHFDEMYKANAGLLFYGNPGTGKTFAASCIANALMDKGVPVLVTSIVRLTAGIFGAEMSELLDKMNTARLLVLDDFGAERNTETKAEQVFSIIDARYAANKPMIITTNLTDFRNETDVRRKRVYDRIFEVCTPVKMDGESKRVSEGQIRRDAVREMLKGTGVN